MPPSLARWALRSIRRRSETVPKPRMLAASATLIQLPDAPDSGNRRRAALTSTPHDRCDNGPTAPRAHSGTEAAAGVVAPVPRATNVRAVDDASARRRGTCALGRGEPCALRGRSLPSARSPSGVVA